MTNGNQLHDDRYVLDQAATGERWAKGLADWREIPGRKFMKASISLALVTEDKFLDLVPPLNLYRVTEPFGAVTKGSVVVRVGEVALVFYPDRGGTHVSVGDFKKAKGLRLTPSEYVTLTNDLMA